jgi:hypothetical protein
MNRFTPSRLFSQCLLALGACAGGTALADTTFTYTYDYSMSVSGCTSGWYSSCGLSGSQTGSTAISSSPVVPAPSDPNAPSASIAGTATGWANTQGNNWTTTDQTLEKGHLQAWGGGLGVRNLDYSTSANGNESRLDSSEGSSPEHATDNQERFDSILYSFNQSFSLTGINLSWYSGDADLSVLAYTGDTSVSGFNIDNSLLNLRYDQLTSSGWTFISHLTTGTYNKSLSTTVSSRIAPKPESKNSGCSPVSWCALILSSRNSIASMSSMGRAVCAAPRSSAGRRASSSSSSRGCRSD